MTQEWYTIRYDEQLANGYWRNGQEDSVSMLVPDNHCKQSHDKARELFAERMKKEGRKVRIFTVTYI